MKEAKRRFSGAPTQVERHRTSERVEEEAAT